MQERLPLRDINYNIPTINSENIQVINWGSEFNIVSMLS